MASQDEKQNDDIKETCRKIVRSFKQEGGSILSALSIYRHILTHYKEGNTYNEESRDYLLNHFLEPSCLHLMKRQYDAHELNVADLVNECCRLLVSIAVPLIASDSEIAANIIYHCLAANTPFHRTYGRNFREKRGCELSETEQAELVEWREKELTIGTHVDYLMSNRWRYGVIKAMKPKADTENTTVLYIEPLMHGISASFIQDDPDIEDEIVENSDAFTLMPTTGSQLSKPLTKSIEQRPHMTEWRKRLRQYGTDDHEQPKTEEMPWKCDCLDTVHKWYTCTILEDDVASNRMKINYDGWSARYDEWVYRDEMKLQPRLTHAKGGRESQGVPGTLDELEPCLEDEEDPEFKEGEGVYAVWRGRLNQLSFHVIDILNAFGKSGGFDAILQRLQNRSPTIPMRLLRYILSPLAKCYKCYSRGFAEKFILPVTELVFEILESLTENEIKDLSKEYLERIVASLELWLMRYKSREEIAQRVELFQLKMALKRLKCVSLDRRVEGAQYVADLCVRSNRAGYGQYSVKFVTSQYLYRWIEDNGLLYLCYGPSQDMLQKNGCLVDGFIRLNFTETPHANSQSQQYLLPNDVVNLIKLWYNEQSDASIMKQSVDILKFIATESQLTLAHLDILWNVVHRYSVSYRSKNRSAKHKAVEQKQDERQDEGDQELSAICEIIEGLMYYFDGEHIAFLVDKIEKLDLSLLTKHHLSIISSACKTFTDEKMAQKCLEFLWKLVQDESKCDNPELVESAVIALCRDLGSKAGETVRLQFVQKYLADLKAHKRACNALSSLRTLLSFMDEENRSLMIAHLIDNEKFMHLYLSDVEHFKQSALQILTQKGLYKPPTEDNTNNNNNNNDKEKDSVEHLLNSKINDLVLFDTDKTYLDEIKERIKLLRFLFKHYSHISLTEEEKQVLYSQFIVHAITVEERKLAVLRFKDIVTMTKSAADNGDDGEDKYPLMRAYDDEEEEEESSSEEDAVFGNNQGYQENENEQWFVHDQSDQDNANGAGDGAAAMQQILQLQQQQQRLARLQQQQQQQQQNAANAIDPEILAALGGDMDHEELLNQQLMLQYYQQQQQ